MIKMRCIIEIKRQKFSHVWIDNFLLQKILGLMDTSY